MATGSVEKATSGARTASQIAAQAALSDDARALLDDSQSPRIFLERLRSQGLVRDAAIFLAFALPVREAVWWAARCVRQILGSAPLEPAETALQAAEAWCQAPEDGRRRRALTVAETAGLDTPAGCVGLAAFLSGGSLAPAELPEVPAAPHLAPTAIAGALQIAAVAHRPEFADERFRGFLDVGDQVARGQERWPERS